MRLEPRLQLHLDGLIVRSRSGERAELHFRGKRGDRQRTFPPVMTLPGARRRTWVTAGAAAGRSACRRLCPSF